jgi:hypothetical protein
LCRLVQPTLTHIPKNVLRKYFTITVKVKLKLALEQATKAQRGSRGIPLLFNFGARCGWVVNATPRLLYHRERDPVPTV